MCQDIKKVISEKKIVVRRLFRGFWSWSWLPLFYLHLYICILFSINPPKTSKPFGPSIQPVFDWNFQNIFLGEDIRKQLPRESADFDDVNAKWKVIMTRMHKEKNALRCTHHEGKICNTVIIVDVGWRNNLFACSNSVQSRISYKLLFLHTWIWLVKSFPCLTSYMWMFIWYLLVTRRKKPGRATILSFYNNKVNSWWFPNWMFFRSIRST